MKTCVAVGCNKSNSDEVSLHKFPNDKVIRKKWVDQVKRHRDKNGSLLNTQCFAACTLNSPALQLIPY